MEIKVEMDSRVINSAAKYHSLVSILLRTMTVRDNDVRFDDRAIAEFLFKNEPVKCNYYLHKETTNETN